MCLGEVRSAGLYLRVQGARNSAKRKRHKQLTGRLLVVPASVCATLAMCAEHRQGRVGRELRGPAAQRGDSCVNGISHKFVSFGIYVVLSSWPVADLRAEG